MEIKSPKTWKREFAGFGVFLPFILLVAFTAYAADVEGRIQLITILWLPVMTLVGGAFGLDYLKKQNGTPPLAEDFSGPDFVDRSRPSNDVDTPSRL